MGVGFVYSLTDGVAVDLDEGVMGQRGWNYVSNTLPVFCDGDVTHGDIRGRGRGTEMRSLRVEIWG